MYDSTVWSVNLGRWAGVQVRLHALFLLFGVCTMYLSTLSGDRQLVGYGVLTMAILFVSVLLHEFAHCYAALRVGGHADEIVLVPFGGLAQAHVPHQPQSELITALAGPAVNLLIWLSATVALLLIGDANVVGLLNPLRPQAVVEGPAPVVFVKLAFWLNWVLVLVNLLPAFPFDGGRALRALLWPAIGYRSAITAVATAAKVAAVAMLLVALFMHDAFPNALVPAWVPLVLVAIFLFFSAKQEVAKLDHQEYGTDTFGYDFSQGYTSLDRDGEVDVDPERDPGMMRRWLDARREEKERQQQEQEAAEEGRVDEILARLHGQGIQGISAEDRALLDRVSARYRNRQSG